MPKAARGPNSISSLTCELAGEVAGEVVAEVASELAADPGSTRLASSFIPALSRSSGLSNCGFANVSQVSRRQGAKPMGRSQRAADAEANAASQDAASLLGAISAMGSGRRYFCNTCACHQKNTAVTGMVMKILNRIHRSTPVNTRLSALIWACAQLKRTISWATAVARKNTATLRVNLAQPSSV